MFGRALDGARQGEVPARGRGGQAKARKAKGRPPPRSAAPRRPFRRRRGRGGVCAGAPQGPLKKRSHVFAKQRNMRGRHQGAAGARTGAGTLTGGRPNPGPWVPGAAPTDTSSTPATRCRASGGGARRERYHRWRDQLVGYAKILLTFLQCVSIVPSATVPWPSWLVRFLELFDFMDLHVALLAGSGCAGYGGRTGPDRANPVYYADYKIAVAALAPILFVFAVCALSQAFFLVRDLVVAPIPALALLPARRVRCPRPLIAPAARPRGGGHRRGRRRIRRGPKARRRRSRWTVGGGLGLGGGLHRPGRPRPQRPRAPAAASTPSSSTPSAVPPRTAGSNEAEDRWWRYLDLALDRVLTYLPVTRYGFAIFDCRAIGDGAWVLRADMRLECYTPRHTWFVSLIVVTTLLYTLLPPVVMVSRAAVEEERIWSEPYEWKLQREYTRVSYLHGEYRRQYYFYEAYEQGRKLRHVLRQLRREGEHRAALLRARAVHRDGDGAPRAPAVRASRPERARVCLALCNIAVLLLGLVVRKLGARPSRSPRPRAGGGHGRGGPVGIGLPDAAAESATAAALAGCLVVLLVWRCSRSRSRSSCSTSSALRSTSEVLSSAEVPGSTSGIVADEAAMEASLPRVSSVGTQTGPDPHPNLLAVENKDMQNLISALSGRLKKFKKNNRKIFSEADQLAKKRTALEMLAEQSAEMDRIRGSMKVLEKRNNALYKMHQKLKIEAASKIDDG